MFEKTKERVAVVQAIPHQLKVTAVLAISALIVALVALCMTVVRYAN